MRAQKSRVHSLLLLAALVCGWSPAACSAPPELDGEAQEPLQVEETRLPRPSMKAYEGISFEWQLLGGRLADYFEVAGQLMPDPAAVKNPGAYDWSTGLWLLVISHPEPELSGVVYESEPTVAAYQRCAGRDGFFSAGLPAADLEEGLRSGQTLEVALAIRRTIHPDNTGSWGVGGSSPWTGDLETDVISGSRARIAAEGVGPFTGELFRRQWNLHGGASPAFGRGEHYYGVEEPLSLLPIPPLSPAPREPLTAEQAAEIEATIDRLAEISSPDAGYSSRLWGSCFLPLPWLSGTGAFVLAPHGLETAPGLRELQELGPAALPFLLDHLDDTRPTAIEPVKPYAGSWWTEHDLSGNVFNPRELEVLGEDVLGPRMGHARSNWDMLGPTLTIGDLCYVALGQVVNRPNYLAMRYQPSGHFVTASPVQDPELAGKLREIWGAENPCEDLLRSLLIDFHTRGSGSGERQVGAAARLAYFFPRESAYLIAARLDGLQLDEPNRDENQIYPEELLAAVSFSREPAIQDAVLRVLERAETASIAGACFPWLEEPPADPLLAKLEEMLETLPLEEASYVGRAYRWLWSSWRLRPDACHQLCERFLSAGSVDRAVSLCLFLERIEAELPWRIELLADLLHDRRETLWFREGLDREGDPSTAVRVCDAAARAIAKITDGVAFRYRGSHSELDERIIELREELDLE